MAAVASTSRAGYAASKFSRGAMPSPGQEDTVAFFQSDDQLQQALAVSESQNEGESKDVPEVEQAPKEGYARESMYVRLFEEMITTVLEHESNLFDAEELRCWERYRSLSYAARYLLVRLLLRKRGRWHRLDSLRSRYSHEIGKDVESAIFELCKGHVPNKPRRDPSVDVTVLDDELRRALAASLESFELEQHARNLSPDVALQHSQPATSVQALSSSTVTTDGTPFPSFAIPSVAATLDDLLETLSLDELRNLAKDMKIKHNQPRKQLVTALSGNASTQITLSFGHSHSRSSAGQPSKPTRRQSLLPFTLSAKKQEDRVRDLALKLIGDAVRIDDRICDLFSRLNLIFFRSTTPTPVLLPLILTTAGRRSYPPYEAKRTSYIFPSRQLLLEYEVALNLEWSIDGLLQGEEGQTMTRLEIAAAVKKLGQSIKGRWDDMVSVMTEDDAMEQRNFLQRFEPGHVLTRIVHKLATAHGELKEYDDEIRILKELLNQKRWRQGKRGGWYERLALILMNHRGNTEDVLREAMSVVIRGLEDPMTHLIYRPSLERRLTRLEKKLDIPEDERHACEGELRKPTVNTIKGVRAPSSNASLRTQSPSPVPRLVRSGKENSSKERETERPDRRSGAKSVWVGKEGEVSVELLALEWYEARGYRGYHSEGRIVSTLFTLLFFDILYMPIAGAFETKYQSAPLDLSYDTFYAARKDAIEKRLQELRDGQGPRIVDEVDDRERSRQTWCVGVRWDLFQKTDLVEIAECVGGQGLAAICRLLCEDYGHRGGGVPDLCIWNASKGRAKFVEVKGPGDSLMETQKVWADVLLSAGINMEVCKVVEEDATEKKKKDTKAKRAVGVKSATKRKSEVITLSDTEDEPAEPSHESRAKPKRVKSAP